MQKSLKINAILNIIKQSFTIVFPLITFPYVSRVLGAEEYGRYAFSATLVTYFQLLAGFGINTYAIREGAAIRDDRKAVSELASDLFSFNVLTCLASYSILALLVLFNPKINTYGLLVFIQSLSLMFNMLGMDWVNNVYEDFLYITIRYLVIQLITLICIFVFVRSSADTAKYCFILVCGSYGGNLINLFYIRRYIRLPRLRGFPIKKYITPLSVLLVNSLATTIYVDSDVTITGLFLNDTQVGLYSFAARLYNILKYFINAAIIVTIPRLSNLVSSDREKYDNLVETILYALITFLLPIATGLFMLSRQIIMVVGGDEYLRGHSSLMILSFSLVFALLASVSTNCILIIHKREKRALTSTIISALVNVILNLILIPVIGIVGAAITTVIAELMNLLITSYFVKKELDVRISLRSNEVISVVAGVVEVVISCSIFGFLWPELTLINSLKQIIGSVVLSGILYLITLICFKNSFVLSFIRKK